ncbi:tRNA uracil 4-sulfurtransferase ThiI [Bacillus pumilus]|uniref:Probable tRNA sulfurtransferase n=1 Tax=Bacillus pumilus (strain SAFR-032) TaxID=315750 RepID=THII_BACP2|nr:tRNA uracil 4-sulfurtransferase ThiI [Bacillus pumilus]A8FG94.1 RecName: Full=Probable tRNA sulfurtransferase; AltName: Full=Sulfur carrier protein ThiS sulfurtransferase; AltName: Full=Thiamine biosynthesis protein ThiI; AltName: Full=tRNA 4-thiouridine synthase [Bacillus pumilus SAFR-032]ABV63261.1 thiamine biosynthesis protein ThiI [Bacillus pumilus SAFR-032]MBC3643177.1 tRNA 4-thiouridine(8) synthase ThiI [Bacillus pumilus]MBC3645626.1 tRNA 4-thiouridine(8) synthase ThiI [Bacillus pumilu
MKYDHILVRFGEISTKGKNRKKFIEKLRQHIRFVLKDFVALKYASDRDRITIMLNGEDPEPISEQLKGVFGIQSFSLAVKCETNLDAIKEAALTAVQEVYEQGNTFKVSTKRSYKQFELDSNEMNREIGGHVLRNTENLTVNVKQPDVHLRIEIREQATYITFKDVKGAGGLPVGSSGRAMLMLSGGFDSPVAGYQAMKRGIQIEAVHFFSPPYTSERAKQKVIDLTECLAAYGGEIKLHIVPFTKIQELIHKQVPENYTMTSTRRMMLKIADKIREKRDALAIITGESLGQVASQTLESMYAINHVTNTPIIRPLIAVDKNDIIDEARRIGTYETSIQPFEDCCTIFTPPSPKTKPKLEKVERYESFADFEPMLDEAVEQIETIIVKNEKKAADEFADLF